MNCEILQTLYVRSNGDVPCNCDAGQNVFLGRIAPCGDGWSPEGLFTNHRYRHIRASLKSATMPWPSACGTCAFFRPAETFSDRLQQKQIAKMQIEPSLACRLRCPGCSNGVQVQIRPSPLRMDLALFERILRGLAAEGYSVGEIEYCGQGEPLLHPEFPRFVRAAREHLPATRQRLITSGNFDYARATQGERLDDIYVSCDGVDPASYVRYRVGGRVECALQFMRDAVRAPHPFEQAVVWKYILFEWNDSPDEIRLAQELAQEIGVRALLFVHTHSEGKSRRHTQENHADFPRYFPNVITNATPVHYQLVDNPVAIGAGEEAEHRFFEARSL